MNKNMKKIRDQSLEELRSSYHDLSRELFQLRNAASLSGKVERPHQFRQTRKQRARVLTAIAEKGEKLGYR